MIDPTSSSFGASHTLSAARGLVVLLVAALTFGLFAPPAAAQLRGTQTQGTIAPIPIAIPDFSGADPRLAADISEIVTADLQHSGLFQPLDRASFLERIVNVNTAPRFPDWRAIQAQALVVGNVSRAGDGRETCSRRWR